MRKSLWILRSAPGTEYVVINVLETGDDYTEQIDSQGMLLTGSTDDELIEAAIQEVTERWDSVYRVLRNEGGGACEITHYTRQTCRQIAITVTSALIPWTELELFDRDNDPVTDEETIRTALDEFRRTGAIDGYFFARLGLPHEDDEDASTWGPESPEAVDWAGFDDVSTTPD